MNRRNDDFSKSFMDSYNNMLNSRNDSDYRMDENQGTIFADILEWMSEHGKIEEVEMIPRAEHAGATVRFKGLFNIMEIDIPKFAEMIKNMSAISIDAETNGDIMFSFVVPNVFKHK